MRGPSHPSEHTAASTRWPSDTADPMVGFLFLPPRRRLLGGLPALGLLEEEGTGGGIDGFESIRRRGGCV